MEFIWERRNLPIETRTGTEKIGCILPPLLSDIRSCTFTRKEPRDPVERSWQIG